jgi:hypothetical protein
MMQVNSGGVGLNSILFSSDKVLRGSDVMSNNNNVFAGFASITAAVNFPAIQLANVTAGTIVLVDEIHFGSTVANQVMLTLNAAALSTLDHVWRSVKDGSTAGTAQILKQDITLGAGNQMDYVYTQASQTMIYKPSFPFILTNGGTLTVNGSISPGNITVGFIGRQFTL